MAEMYLLMRQCCTRGVEQQQFSILRFIVQRF